MLVKLSVIALMVLLAGVIFDLQVVNVLSQPRPGSI